MIYMSYCVHGWVMCTRTRDEAWPATMDGGGRDGVLVVLARARRTRKCGDAFPVPNLVGDRAEGGR
jgi:hypothetical protein